MTQLNYFFSLSCFYCRQNLEKLRQAVDKGRKNAVTKKNKAIITANETLNKLSSELNKKMAQVRLLYTVMILGFRKVLCGQTVQTQIRLLLLQSDRVFTVCIYVCIFRWHYLNCDIILLDLYCNYSKIKPFEPRCEKTGLRGFRPGPTQTGLYNHTRWLEA